MPVLTALFAVLGTQGVGLFAGAAAQVYNITRTLRAQEKQQESAREQQKGLAAEERDLRLQMQEREHEERKKQHTFALEEQRRLAQHTLAVSVESLYCDVADDAPRCFIAPPEDLTLNTQEGVLWKNVHGAQLDDLVRKFSGDWYGPESPRPIHVFGREALNPKRRSGPMGPKTLWQETQNIPTVWLEATRTHSESCVFYMDGWDRGHRVMYKRLGEVPNYSLAVHRSMATAVALSDQRRQAKGSNEAESEKRLPETMRAYYWQLQHTTLQQMQELLARNKDPNAGGMPPPPRLDDPAVARMAIEYLATAYNMFLAAAADAHHLAKHGIAPLLPTLVRDGVFDMEDPYIQTATRRILADYVLTAGQLAAACPNMAADIWLGMAEASLTLKDLDAVATMILEAARVMVAAQAQRSVAPLNRLDDLPSALAALSLERANRPKIDRIGALLEAVGRSDLVEAFKMCKSEMVTDNGCRHTPNAHSLLDEHFMKMASKATHYYS